MPKALCCGLLFLCMSFAAAVFAAPLPPFPPVDVIGTITEVKWVPEQQVKAIPGMSGSAGHDRVFPAHFLITLAEYSGIDTATAWQMTRLVDWHALDGFAGHAAPPFIVLQIQHPNPQFLQKDMRIHVTGYVVRGDEGGTWTSCDRIAILHH